MLTKCAPKIFIFCFGCLLVFRNSFFLRTRNICKNAERFHLVIFLQTSTHITQGAYRIRRWESFFSNLVHKFFILIHSLHSYTCFERYCAHLQEKNCINTASGIVTVFRWLFSKQFSRNLCTEQSPKETDDTRCCVNTVLT